MKEDILIFASKFISGEASGPGGMIAIIAIVAMVVVGTIALADAWRRRKTKQ